MMIVAIVIDYMVLNYTLDDKFTPFVFSFQILILFPSLSVTARRLHDIGMSGWYQGPFYLIYLDYLESFLPSIPESVMLWVQVLLFIYIFGLIITMVRDSHSMSNQYGANLKSYFRRAS